MARGIANRRQSNPHQWGAEIALGYTLHNILLTEEALDSMLDENPEDTGGLEASSREFLACAIADYNMMHFLP